MTQRYHQAIPTAIRASLGFCAPIGRRIRGASLARDMSLMLVGRPVLPPLLAPLRWASLVVVAGCGSHQHKPEARAVAAPVCELSTEDAEWLENSLQAWEGIAKDRLRIVHEPRAAALFFDAACTYRAAVLVPAHGTKQFTAQRHHGAIALPTGQTIPPGVSTFAAPGNQQHSVFFVMSTPSVWRSGGVRSGLPLSTFMTAVLIHEFSHTEHFATYMRRVTEIESEHRFEPELNDDVVQDTFKDVLPFRDSVTRETDLLFEAALAPTDGEAKELAREGMALLRKRRERYLVGPHAILQELEDIFLTLEGSGQWAGYTWLTQASGGHVAGAQARAEFGRRSRFWSQNEGLALFLVLDRLNHDWVRIVYGNGSSTILPLLAEALSN